MQMTGILNKATSRSLVLIDEFGKGTLTSDGVGLLAATLESLAAHPNPPQVLACTHFSELLQPSVLAPSPQIQFHTMAVVLPMSCSAEEGHVPERGSLGTRGAGYARSVGGDGQQGGELLLEQHVFLYKLVPGHAAASFGVSEGGRFSKGEKQGQQSHRASKPQQIPLTMMQYILS
jgi:DNA mismatch repair ATPase MutS